MTKHDDHVDSNGANREEKEEHGLRATRMKELMDAALKEPDPLQANLVASACGFMKMGARVEVIINEAMERSCGSVGDLQKLLGPIELQLKITRQFDRLVGLVARMQNQNQRSQAND